MGALNSSLQVFKQGSFFIIHCACLSLFKEQDSIQERCFYQSQGVSFFNSVIIQRNIITDSDKKINFYIFLFKSTGTADLETLEFRHLPVKPNFVHAGLDFRLKQYMMVYYISGKNCISFLNKLKKKKLEFLFELIIFFVSRYGKLSTLWVRPYSIFSQALSLTAANLSNWTTSQIIVSPTMSRYIAT